MDELAYSLVRASAVREFVVRARSVGIVAYLVCSAVRPRDVLSAAGCAVYVDIKTCAPQFMRVCVWYGVRHMQRMAVCLMCVLCGRVLLTGAECAAKGYNGIREPYFTQVCVWCGLRYVQSKWCTFGHVCVYMCLYGGRQVQSEPCTHRREYVCMCMHGVRHVRTEWCTFRAEVCVRMLAQCSACAVRVVYLLCVACAVYPLHASGVERVLCTCVRTWYSVRHGLLSDAPIVRECACVDVHLGREHIQCLVWAA